ncbi:hypothetical protein BJ875DRAFT_487431 [Amylocarpus encephaloides]|uniref:Uncharacterized protein n=1 Tax=Amylocarpus encephaloides TaxID=45428 RepID=A0A9P8C245_9HELO|nr:hypothetical protein BJ875DRAFT_487431 [Amylocarpus encephaloides]
MTIDPGNDESIRKEADDSEPHDSKKHQDRLFEHFYLSDVDENRCRRSNCEKICLDEGYRYRRTRKDSRTSIGAITQQKSGETRKPVTMTVLSGTVTKGPLVSQPSAKLGTHRAQFEALIGHLLSAPVEEANGMGSISTGSVPLGERTDLVLGTSPPAALTNPIPTPPNDPHDVHEPVTPTPSQRQQQHPLRRTHIEATSVGISPPRVRFAEQQRSRRQQELTNDFEDDLATSTPVAPRSLHNSPEAERRTHRVLHISKHTASSVLYALEEALRHPHPFTPDLIEENASMSDLLGGPSASAGNGRSGARQTASGTTGSPVIKGPRDIMRERAARDARKKAEQDQREALERQRATEESRQIEENNRRSEERRAAITAAGAAAQQRPERGQRGSGGTTGQRISDNSQRSERRSGDRPLEAVGSGGRAVGGGESAPARPRPSQSQQQPRPVPPESSRPRTTQAQDSSSAGPSNPNPKPPPEARGSGTRSSFPHAFERWETLSAHWEGLTSYWIRRLEENSTELNRDPLSQQLSRQVTDLSAAGANLFHAVVELQRLRASSERKFQRWFFETRIEQERAQEVQAMTDATLQSEREQRARLINEAVSQERERSNADKQLAEMKRELQISKEEARRAWEELGRREQEERERTSSLREGQPTLVGGVQVVPMMQGVPSRHGSTRDAPPTREGAYTGGASSTAQEPEGPVDSDVAYQAYSRAQRAEPADPFVEQQSASRSTRTTASSAPTTTYAQDHSQAPAVQPASTSSAFYQQHQGTSLHPTERDPSLGAPSEGAFSEEEYAIGPEGQFIRDARGNKVPFRAPVSDDDTDEYDVDEDRERELANLQRYGTSAEYRQGATATSGVGQEAATSQPATTDPGSVDYTGSGYGTGLEWGAVPRHHHPTRLSDVLEEDERSRTSASQVGRRE